MGTVSRVHTFASGAILTAAQLNNEFDNLLTSSAINGGLDATNLGVTAGQATASKALVVDASRNLADATGSNRINNLALSGTFESTGAITATAGITSGGNIVSDTDSTDDLGTTGVRWANLFVDDVTVTNNVTIGGTLTLTGGITLNGNTTIGDSSADTLTVNSTITSNLIFTDATYDIGASGATRPRNLYLSGNGVVGGTLGVTGLITASGGVSGALTGDVTGNISGNVTGGTISGTTGTFSGDLTVGTTDLIVDVAANKVGIGGTPTEELDIQGSGATQTIRLIRTDASTAGGITINSGNGSNYFYNTAAKDLILSADNGATQTKLHSNGDFSVNTSQLFVDQSTARVGIGTTSPSSKLDVAGTFTITGAGQQMDNGQGISAKNASGTYRQLMVMDGSNNLGLGGTVDGGIIFYTSLGNERARIDASGNMGLGVSPSGYSADKLVVSADSGDGITIAASTTSDANYIFFADGTSGTSAYRGQIMYGHTNDEMVLATATQTALTIDSSQRIGIGTGSPSYKTEIAAGASTEGLAVTASSGDVYLQTDGQLHGYQKLDDRTAGLQLKGFSDGGGTKTEQAKIYLIQANTGSAGGEIRFHTNNGSGTVERARITKDGDARFFAASGDGMYWDHSASSLGIGTSSPSTKLVVSDGTYGLEVNPTGYQVDLFSYNRSTSAYHDMRIDSEQLILRTGNPIVERLRIDSSGNLLVGTTSTTIGTSSFGTVFLSTQQFAHSRNANGSSAVAQFFGNAGECRIKGDGDLENTNNSYGAISDERLKSDIVDASSQLADIKSVKIRKYTLNENGETHIGVVAQELEAAGMEGLVDTDEDGYKSVKYSVLYVKAVKALQEAITKIETLETKVAALEAA